MLHQWQPFLAVGVGFEPTRVFTLLAFETSAFVHSAILLGDRYRIRTCAAGFPSLPTFQIGPLIHSGNLSILLNTTTEPMTILALTLTALSLAIRVTICVRFVIRMTVWAMRLIPMRRAAIAPQVTEGGVL